MLLPDNAIRVVTCAERIAAGWGQDYHHTALTAAIVDLYRNLIAFPAVWPAHRRNAFIADAADTAASELTTLLDNHLGTHADSAVPSPGRLSTTRPPPTPGCVASCSRWATA